MPQNALLTFLPLYPACEMDKCMVAVGAGHRHLRAWPTTATGITATERR